MRSIFGPTLALWIVTFSFVSSQTRLRVKTAFGKDSTSVNSPAINELTGKVSNLEGYVARIRDKITKVETQNKDIEELLREDSRLLGKADLDFRLLMNAVSTHGNMLEELKKSVYPDEKAFAFSNDTCGGVLDAQAGYVTYSSASTLFSWPRPLQITSLRQSSCIWVIQANHRSAIKLTSQILELVYGTARRGPVRNAAYVLEGISEPTFLPTKVTKLMKGVPYLFKGPLLYVVLHFPESPLISSVNTFKFQFQYESKGHLKETDKIFLHKQIDAFSQKKLRIPQDLEISNEDEPLNNSSVHFSSIMISNVTTRLTLGSTWVKSQCANSSLVIWPLQALLNSSHLNGTKNLCDISSSSEKIMQIYGEPVVVFLSKPAQSPFSVNLTWLVDPVYSSNFVDSEATSAVSNQSCGGVVGGSAGYISYKRDTAGTRKYRNGERCVWMIVPQPSPTESIEVSLFRYIAPSQTQITKETQDYDPVYLMELTYANGSEREDGPKLTNLVHNKIYTISSREVYVIFYSDDSVVGKGFAVNWKTTGEIVESEVDEQTDFNLVGGWSGEVTVNSRERNWLMKTRNLVFVFNPLLPSLYKETPNYVFGMDFQFSLTSSSNESSCEDIYVLAAGNDGMLKRVEMDTNNGCKDSKVLKDVSGLAMIIYKQSASMEGQRLTFNYKWIQDDASVAKLEDDKCGGVVIGTMGVLRYKLEEKYNRNEHCIWLISSPNSTSISLKLVKNGFNLDEKVVVNTVDADIGKLRNDTVWLMTPVKYHFNESLLVISFRPSSSYTNSTGFLLHFWSSNASLGSQGRDESDEIIDFRLRHSGVAHGRFLYDWNNQSSHSQGKQLHLIGFSRATFTNTAPKPPSVNVQWILGTFLKDMTTCTHDSVTFYVTTLTNDTSPFWKQVAYLPQADEESDESTEHSCPSQIIARNKPKLFTVEYTAFLVIYKLVEYPVDKVGMVDRGIDFGHSEIHTSTRANSTEEEIDTDYDYLLTPARRGSSYIAYGQRHNLYHMLQRYHRQQMLGWGMGSRSRTPPARWSGDRERGLVAI